MASVLFYSAFPELAERETRSFMIPGDSDLPEDTYELWEMYCDEPGCDCRRVIFSVMSAQQKKPMAVIGYGWESVDYYAKVFTFAAEEPDTLLEIKGPILEPLSRQSALAPAILQAVRDIVLQDEAYIERLKRHYAMFRDYVDNPAKRPGAARKSKSTAKRRPRRRTR